MWFLEWPELSFVADSTLVDPDERALESAVHAARSVSEDVHGALEFYLAHVSPRVSTSVVSCRGVAQRASMVHAPVSSNRFSAFADDEVEVHPDSGSETVSMGDVEQFVRLKVTRTHVVFRGQR